MEKKIEKKGHGRKALAEIYTMHSFAPFLESKFEKLGKKNLTKTTVEMVKMRSA